MAAPPAWFKSFILFELLFQLPLLHRIQALRAEELDGYGASGAHTATTLIPILAEISYPATVFPDGRAVRLFFIYLPYLLVPASMAYALGGTTSPSAKGGPNKLKIF